MSDKIQFRQSEVKLPWARDLNRNPNKIKVVQKMPDPSDEQGVLIVQRMANYVQKFTPNLAKLITALRE